MPINITVKGSQQASAALRKALNEYMTDKFITVGIHEDENSPRGDSINNATLGAIQHFGNNRIPARPWLDVGVASGNKDYIRAIEQNANDPETALRQIGVIAVGKVQQYLTELDTPPNAPGTVAKKGSSNPLIDTGELRQSVTYEVTSSAPKEGL